MVSFAFLAHFGSLILLRVVLSVGLGFEIVFLWFKRCKVSGLGMSSLIIQFKFMQSKIDAHNFLMLFDVILRALNSFLSMKHDFLAFTVKVIHPLLRQHVVQLVSSILVFFK